MEDRIAGIQLWLDALLTEYKMVREAVGVPPIWWTES
jgi:hypothetical protein